MATQGLFQLLGESPQEVRRKYEAGLMLTPEAMAQQGLLQQVASTIAQGGASAGYGLGRMLGAKAPGEAEAEAQQAALLEAQQSGLSGSALYKRLADISSDPRRAFVLRQQAAQMEAAEAKAAQDAQDAALQRRLTQARVEEIEGKPAATAAAKENISKMLIRAGFSQEDAEVYSSDPTLARDLIKEARKPGGEKLTFRNVGDKVVALDSQGNIVKTIGDAPKAASTTVVLKNASDAVDFSKKYDGLIERERIAYQGARDGMRLLNEAAQKGDAEGNVSAWNAARTVIAKALGDGRLSNADIERLGGSAGLFRAVEDIISKAFTGVPSPETQAQLYKVAKILELAKIEQMNRITNQAREVYKQDFPEKASEARLNLYFPKAPVPFGSLR
jgi:hypothetical protein